jgi:hypothetical protein
MGPLEGASMGRSHSMTPCETSRGGRGAGSMFISRKKMATNRKRICRQTIYDTPRTLKFMVSRGVAGVCTQGSGARVQAAAPGVDMHGTAKRLLRAACGERARHV